MRSLLLLLCFFIAAFSATAQTPFFYGDGPFDSFTVRFNTDTTHIIPDAAATPLWQRAHNHKVFFGSDTTTVKMMTDTLNPYPVHANNYFVVRIPNRGNPVVTFWHRYQTDSAKDGGIVEYSGDRGLHWFNVKDSCNIDGVDHFWGILTDGFYKLSDTLRSGGAAFSGQCDTTRISAFEFATGPGVKSTAGHNCYFFGTDTFYVRFRFVSDSVSDTLAGWAIDSVKVVYYMSGGSVHTVNDNLLQPFPNPSSTGIFNFPTVPDAANLRIEIVDPLGRKVYTQPYTGKLDISHLQRGIYCCRITGGTLVYSTLLRYE